MSHLQSQSITSCQYIKTYQCKSSTEVSSLVARNLINDKFLPKFEIFSSKLNTISVLMAHYPKNGIQEIFKVLTQKNTLLKRILQIFNAYFLLQNLFGKFELTKDKIKADEHGNIVLWISSNYQEFFPLKRGKSQIQRGQYKIRFDHFLEDIRQILMKKQVKNNSQSILLKLYQEIFHIQNFILIQHLDLYYIQFNQKIQKHWSKFFKMKPSNVRIQKTFSISEFYPFQEKSKQSEKLKKVHFKKEYAQRFSYNKDDLQMKSKTKNNTSHFKNRFSNFENFGKEDFFARNVEQKMKVRNQVKIPKFIRQKQLCKSDQIPTPKNKIQRNCQSIKQFDFVQKIKTQKAIQTFNQTAINYLHHQQSFEVYETSNQEQNQNFSILNQNSTKDIDRQQTEISQKNEFKSTRSSFKMVSQISTDHGFFVSKLSLKEEKQIEQDLFELFSSRCKASKEKETNMDYDDEQLAKQFLCILN